jgi:hypothetical protein
VVQVSLTLGSAIFLKKGSRTHRVALNLVRDGSYLYRSQEKKVLECNSGLHPSEKELTEWRSNAFRHKNTPDLREIYAGLELAQGVSVVFYIHNYLLSTTSWSDISYSSIGLCWLIDWACRWGETSQNHGHQRVCCSSPQVIFQHGDSWWQWCWLGKTLDLSTWALW